MSDNQKRRDAVVFTSQNNNFEEILTTYNNSVFVNQRNDYVKCIKTSKFRNFQSLKEKILLYRLINNQNAVEKETTVLIWPQFPFSKLVFSYSLTEWFKTLNHLNTFFLLDGKKIDKDRIRRIDKGPFPIWYMVGK